jgi:hypothetical protein
VSDAFDFRRHDIAIDAAGRIVAAGSAAGDEDALMRVNPWSTRRMPSR